MFITEEKREIGYLDGTVQSILQSTAGGRDISGKECALVPGAEIAGAVMDCGSTTV